MILLFISILVIFGLICVTTSSVAVAKRIDVKDSYFLVKHINYAVISFIVMLLASAIPVEVLKKYAFHCFICSIFFVISTLFLGEEIKGSKRWLKIFHFSIQPSEFLRVFFAIFNALILANDNESKYWQKYITSFILCTACILLLVLQPDIGMACLIFITWLGQIFISGISIFLFFIPCGFFVSCCALAYICFEHVRQRINGFLYSTEESYQIKQAIAAFSNGGLFGVGAGQGKIKSHLPDSHSDFIFSVIGEEFGSISCLCIIAIYVSLTVRVLYKVNKEHDIFQIFTVSGLILQFIFQALINIGVNIRVLPAKGMTLPFISYGGSSMLATAILLGVVLAINKKQYGFLINTKLL